MFNSIVRRCKSGREVSRRRLRTHYFFSCVCFAVHRLTHLFSLRERKNPTPPPACSYDALAFSANTCTHGACRNPQCLCTEHSAGAASALRHIIESGLTSNAALWLPHRSGASRRGLKYLIRWQMTAGGVQWQGFM